MAQGFGYAASSHLDLVLEFQSNTMTTGAKSQPKEEAESGMISYKRPRVV
jgi:hypothetical protein